MDNSKTNELFNKEPANTEVNKKDKKKDERKKKNVKFSNNNAKTDKSVCNIENVNLNQKDKINSSDYRARERIERRDRGLNYNLNKNDCSSNKSPIIINKEAKVKLMRSKTERNYKEYSNDNKDEDLDDVHELGTATKYTASVKSSKKRRSSKKSDSQQSSRKQTSANYKTDLCRTFMQTK